MPKLNLSSLPGFGHRSGTTLESSLTRGSDNIPTQSGPPEEQTPTAKKRFQQKLKSVSNKAREKFFPSSSKARKANALPPESVAGAAHQSRLVGSSSKPSDSVSLYGELIEIAPETNTDSDTDAGKSSSSINSTRANRSSRPLMERQLRLASKSAVLPAEIALQIVDVFRARANAVIEKRNVSIPHSLAPNEAAVELYTLAKSFLPFSHGAMLWVANEDRAVAMDILAQDKVIRKSVFDEFPNIFSDASTKDGLAIATLMLASTNRRLIQDQKVHESQIERNEPIRPADDWGGRRHDLAIADADFKERVDRVMWKLKTSWGTYSAKSDEKNCHVLANLTLGFQNLGEKDAEWAISEIEEGLDELDDQPLEKTAILNGLATSFPWDGLNPPNKSQAVEMFCTALAKLSPKEQISLFEKLPSNLIQMPFNLHQLEAEDIQKLFTIANNFLEKTKGEPELHLRGLSSILAKSGDGYSRMGESLFRALDDDADKCILGHIENYLDSDKTSVAQKASLLEKVYTDTYQVVPNKLTPELMEKMWACTTSIINSPNREMTNEHRGAIATLIPPIVRDLIPDREIIDEVMPYVQKGLKAAGTHPAMADAMQKMIDNSGLGRFEIRNEKFTRMIVTEMSVDQLHLLSAVLNDNIATGRLRGIPSEYRLEESVISDYKKTLEIIADEVRKKSAPAQTNS